LKIAEFPTFKGSWSWPDLGSSHTAYRHASLVTSTYIPSVTEIEETFCGRTYVRTDGLTVIWDRNLLGRLGGDDLINCEL